MLHGLKGMNGERIDVPREASLRPDRDRLEKRYAAFTHATGRCGWQASVREPLCPGSRR